MLGAASVTRVSDIISVSYRKETLTKLGTGISHSAEKGRVAAREGKESQRCKTAPHARKVGMILPFKESIRSTQVMNSGNV